MAKTNVIFWIKYISLGAIGMYENIKLCIIYTLVYLAFFTFGIFGSIVGLMNATNGKEKLLASTSITVQLFAVIIFIQMIRRKRDIVMLLLQLDKDEFCFDEIVNRINDLLVERLIMLLSWTFFLSILFNLPSVYFLLQNDVKIGKEDLLIPYWFSCSEKNSSGSILYAVCWKINTRAELLLATILQMIIMLWITLTHLLPFVLYSITVSHLLKHFESIKIDLNIFKEVANRQIAILRKQSRNINDNSELSIRTDKFLTGNFLNIFKHQQRLHNRSLQMVKTWKGFVTCYSFSCNSNLILLMFILRTELSEPTSMAYKSFVTLLFLCLVAFIIAYSSQVVSNLNEHIFQELSTIKWYDLSLKFRKVYLTTLALNQISVKMKIAEIIELNLYTFGKIVKTKYSILNMLLLKYGK